MTTATPAQTEWRPTEGERFKLRPEIYKLAADHIQAFGWWTSNWVVMEGQPYGGACLGNALGGALTAAGCLDRPRGLVSRQTRGHEDVREEYARFAAHVLGIEWFGGWNSIFLKNDSFIDYSEGREWAISSLRLMAEKAATL